MRDYYEGFPGGRSAAGASFNALYNVLWILLKQSMAFFPDPTDLKEK